MIIGPQNFPALFLLTALSLVSCRELVQSDFPDLAPVPVLNSILVADSPLQIHLSLAGKVGPGELPAIPDAEVQLYINGEYAETLPHTDDGLYISEALATPGNWYECRVQVPGFPQQLTALDTLPMPPSVRNIQHIRNAWVDDEGVVHPSILLTLAHDPAQTQYFELVIKAETPDRNWVLSTFDIVDPVLLAEGLPIAVFSNEHMPDTTYTLQHNYTTGTTGSSNDERWTAILFPFRLEVRAISRHYYHYTRQLYLYETGRYPDIIGGVVTSFPLYSNVEDGYGIFAGMTVFTSDLITP